MHLSPAERREASHRVYGTQPNLKSSLLNMPGRLDCGLRRNDEHFCIGLPVGRGYRPWLPVSLFAKVSFEGDGSALRAGSVALFLLWVPAFAGMTVEYSLPLRGEPRCIGVHVILSLSKDLGWGVTNPARTCASGQLKNGCI